jgi:hypothetical protein
MANCKLLKDVGPQGDGGVEVMWGILFQNVIKSFMYAMVCIRPNITWVVRVVTHFMVDLAQSH